MSVALIIRNINPDCDPNTQLLVVTMDDSNAITAEMNLAPYPNAATTFNAQGQVYWFPRVTQVQDHGVFLNSDSNQGDTDNSNDNDYLWFCELDQAV